MTRCTRPEQSMPLLSSPPNTYGTPRYFFAVSTIAFPVSPAAPGSDEPVGASGAVFPAVEAPVAVAVVSASARAVANVVAVEAPELDAVVVLGLGDSWVMVA